MRHVSAILHGTVCLALIAFLGYATLLVRDVRLKTLPQITQAATDADRTEWIVAGVATNLEKESRTWQGKQNQVADQATRATALLNSDLVELGGLLSTAQSTLQTQSTSLSSLESAATASVQRTGPILDNLQEASASLASSAANPDIPATLHEVRLTSESTAQASENIQASTKDIASFVHRETAPVKGTWNVIKAFLREFAGPAADVTTAIK